MSADIGTTTVGVWQVVTTAGELDHDAAAVLDGVLTDLIQVGAEVVVDLSGVSRLSCACVHILVNSARRAATDGVALRVVGARGTVLRVLDITGATVELGIDAGGTPGPEHSGRDVAADVVEAMLAARAALPEADKRRDLLRERCVQICLPLAERLAGRYRRPHEPGDELTQVGVVGLLKAVDRFDPARGTSFLAFAFPTILGEIRRYFRDQTWAVHVPRQVQELRLVMKETAGSMAQVLGREPTDRELADQLDEPVENLWEAMVAAQAYAPVSLSEPVGDSGTFALADLLGVPDKDLDRVDYHESLAPLLAALPEREQQALAYRFFGNMTQIQIAGILGVSQMQVSRLLTRALARLRAGLLASEAA